MKENGGRFLKRDCSKNTWTEVSDRKATEKTSQALREGLDVRQKTSKRGALAQRQNKSMEEGRKERRIEPSIPQTPTIHVAATHPTSKLLDPILELNEESMLFYLPPLSVSHVDFHLLEEV